MSLLDFYLITDTHFFKNSLGAYGKEYDEFMRFEQKCFAETEAINNAIFDYLATQTKTDTILTIPKYSATKGNVVTDALSVAETILARNLWIVPGLFRSDNILFRIGSESAINPNTAANDN